MKRLKKDYAEAHKYEGYSQIQAPREKGDNKFDGITSASTKDDMVAALEDDDGAGSGDNGGDKPAVGSGHSTEPRGVGSSSKTTEDENVPVPDEVRIPRAPSNREQGLEISEHGPKVTGDQTIVAIDVMQSTAVEVTLIEGLNLDPAKSGDLVFVQGTVSNDLFPVATGRSKFACKQDGTLIYNARGFDDVPGDAKFDLVDIAALIRLNQKGQKK